MSGEHLGRERKSGSMMNVLTGSLPLVRRATTTTTLGGSVVMNETRLFGGALDGVEKWRASRGRVKCGEELRGPFEERPGNVVGPGGHLLGEAQLRRRRDLGRVLLVGRADDEPADNES